MLLTKKVWTQPKSWKHTARPEIQELTSQCIGSKIGWSLGGWPQETCGQQKYPCRPGSLSNIQCHWPRSSGPPVGNEDWGALSYNAATLPWHVVSRTYCWGRIVLHLGLCLMEILKSPCYPQCCLTALWNWWARLSKDLGWSITTITTDTPRSLSLSATRPQAGSRYSQLVLEAAMMNEDK